MIDKWTGKLGNKKSSSDHPDYSLIKIIQNTDSNYREKQSANVGEKNY